MSTTKYIYAEFYTLDNYLESQKHLNKAQGARELVEYLINKIVGKPNIKCMIQERPLVIMQLYLYQFHLLNKVKQERV